MPYNFDYDAIALSGGAALGAYQIGIMEVLEESGLLDSIKCYAGSSVGALNSVLFALKDVELAKKIWLEDVSVKTMLGDIGVKNGGLLKRDSLRDILRRVGLERLNEDGCPRVYVNLCNEDDKRTEPVLLNEEDPERITKYLLASSAFPFFYPPEYIDGKKYYDGGWDKFDPLANYPVEILYKNNYRKILLVALGADFDSHNIGKKRVDIHAEYPDAKIDVIVPSEPVTGKGGLSPDLAQFDSDYTRMRIAFGRSDMHKFLGMVRKSELDLRSVSETIRKYNEITKKQIEQYLEYQIIGSQADENIDKLIKKLQNK